MNAQNLLLRNLGRLAHILASGLMIAALLINAIPPQQVLAGAGALWTTRTTCTAPDPVNANQYSTGETVHIRGDNFDPNTEVLWTIEKPGSPGIIASGSGLTDSTGYFCIAAHTIQPGEDGVYKYEVTVGNSKKSDNYSVIGIVPAPALTITKTANPLIYTAAGQVISYSYLLTNSGNVILASPFTVTDDKATVTCPVTPETANLDPGESMTCVASYIITQADMDAGSVTNTAQGHGFFGTTPVDSNFDSETITGPQMPSMTLAKTATPATYSAVGQMISYSYLVTNTGNITLTGISVTDDKATVSCPGSTLAPLATMICTASYNITQADLDRGYVTNLATASSTQTGQVQDSETVNALIAPAILLNKVASPATYDSVGDVISYSYIVTNTGNVTLTGITVIDDRLGQICSVASLAPQASTICTASYTITQADLDAGLITNVGTADSNQTSPVTDTETVNAIRLPALALDKVASPTIYDSVGDVISYSYLVTNTGNVTLTGITVTDDRLGPICTVASLAPLAATTCTTSYTITQADLNAGSITNVGTADSDQTSPVTDIETVRAQQNFGLSLDKIASPETYDAVGDVISYSYLVTNTGNIPLTGITVTDDKTTVICPKTALSPAESMTCTASYTITQADLNASSVTNLATVDSPQTDPVQDSETVTAVHNPGLSIIKSASPANYDAADDVISYTYFVSNTGNITLTGITVTDDKASVVCPATTLAPAANMTCTAFYIILQADVENGSLTNIAIGDSDQTGAVQDSETVTALQNPAMTLTKSADPVTYNQENQVITYSYLVVNTGNITLTNITVTDNKATVDCLGITSLLPAGSMTCLATYMIAQADLDNGSVTNLAIADSKETAPVNDSKTINANRRPAMTMVKTALPTTYDAVSDSISYSYLVTNTGNITLTDIFVTDDKASVSCPSTSLVPTVFMTCTASYLITQADLDGGLVTNHAMADSFETDPVLDEETVYASQQPSMTLVKTATPVTYDGVGDIISYSYLVTNTGNINLTGIVVNDDKAGVVCPATTLVPNDFMTCAASYTITQADLDSGSVTNHALVDSNETDPVPDEATVTAAQRPTLTLVKSADPLSYDAADDVISYSYLVTNTGNITLTGITVTDDKAIVTCPGSTLAPGEFMTCTAFYGIVQGDLDQGFVTNTAQADSDQTGPFTDAATVNANVNALLSLVKSASPATYDALNNVISYSYLVTNQGNITLTGITVTDDKALVTCPGSTLAPAASMTCTASYTITQADLDSGSVTNIAVADSTESNSVQDAETVYATQNGSISLVKSASPDLYGTVGDTISYSYLVTNLGNITLTGITVTDDKATVSCPASTLAPGATMTCTASYLITQIDLDSGLVTNTALADSNETGSVRDVETVSALQLPALTMEKTAMPETYAAVDDVISYTYLVTNTGNITLTGIHITDDKAVVTCPADKLAPTESMTCTAEYLVTQADIDEGFITNTAQVLSDQADPFTDTATVNANIEAILTITKSADPATYSASGQVIEYTYVVTNAGNVTLSNLVVYDDKASVTCPSDTLAPGQSMTCSATYIISNADLVTGSVVNTAYAEGIIGTDEDGESIRSNEATAKVNRFVGLVLVAFCSADPVNYDGWRVSNGNGYPVSFEYIIADSNVAGVGEVPANGVAEIYTPHGAGNGILKLYTGGNLQASASAATNCVAGTTKVPEVPIIPTPFVVIPPAAPALIPVTGMDTGQADVHLPTILFSMGIGFAGLGFLLGGISRRRKDI